MICRLIQIQNVLLYIMQHLESGIEGTWGFQFVCAFISSDTFQSQLPHMWDKESSALFTEITVYDDFSSTEVLFEVNSVYISFTQASSSVQVQIETDSLWFDCTVQRWYSQKLPSLNVDIKPNHFPTISHLSELI